MFFIKIIALALEFAHRYSKKRVSNNLLLLVTTKLSEDSCLKSNIYAEKFERYQICEELYDQYLGKVSQLKM